MNRTETALALTLTAAIDRRTIGETDVEAWHLTLGDLDYADVRDAIAEHYRTSRVWLMPADIRERVHQARRTRLSAVPDPLPDADPDDPAAYIAALRAGRSRVADGGQHRPVAAILAHVEDDTRMPS